MNPARRQIRFHDEAEVIADVERLRKGYKQVGQWSLPQMAWHLNQAVLSRMTPGPHPADTSEQVARKPMLQHVLSMHGYLPDGISAPDSLIPPRDTAESAVDDLIESLRRLKSFPGPIAPHRLFGQIPDADARKLNLIHCAHHLSYLIPT
jgi:hypothetical protein